jgi:cysteine desulfurase
MTTNNETGANNNILKIGQIAADHHIPFHTDVVQIFGRSRIKPIDLHIDAMSLSFHKIYGPPGVGVLLIRNSFIAGYDLQPIVYGTQNYGLRGGTINTPGIAGAYTGFKYTLENRSKKNTHLRELKDMIIAKIERKVPCCYLDDYVERNGTQVVWIAPKAKSVVVPWTILLAVDKPGVCNAKLKEALEKRGIIVSIGSACNTSDAKASHVIYALGIPARLKPGVLRISMGYDTTHSDAMTFVNEFLALIKK